MAKETKETKETETKKTPKKSLTRATTTARKPAAKSAPPARTEPKPRPKAAAKQPVTPLERWRMIAEAAYYRAEKRGFFGGNPMEDWAAAEQEIDANYEVDLSKVMTVLDPSEMMEELRKGFSGIDLHGVDLSAVLETQRKNVEALTQANQRVFETAQAMLDRQMEMLKEAMSEASAVLSDLSATKSPTRAASGELWSKARTSCWGR